MLFQASPSNSRQAISSHPFTLARVADKWARMRRLDVVQSILCISHGVRGTPGTSPGLLSQSYQEAIWVSSTRKEGAVEGGWRKIWKQGMERDGGVERDEGGQRETEWRWSGERVGGG